MKYPTENLYNPSRLDLTVGNRTKQFKFFGLFFLSSALLVIAYRSGLSEMVNQWDSEEYSHGYLIPLVSCFLLIQKLPALTSIIPQQRWISLLLISFGIALLAVGEISTLYVIIQYGFLVSFVGILVAAFGLNGAILVWAPVAYLIFMIPLPNFLYQNLSGQLQLVSSSIGVAVIRLLDISVFLEGNVIDLGTYKLQVVEACSGLRYLFPLMSFGFLISYLYQAPLWQRIVIFISTIPMTILMNSFRIAVIGITVNYWGIAAAEGFLHDFEGWVVFIACIGLLALEIWLLHKLLRYPGSVIDRINLDLPEFSAIHFSAKQFIAWKPLLAVTLIIVIALPVGLFTESREERVMARSPFTLFPLLHGEWTGREGRLGNTIIDTLQVSDYFVADYMHRASSRPVNFYVAYYDSQRKGASIHSPRSCIPGDGWNIASLQKIELAGIQGFDGNLMQVNRAIIQKGNQRSLVYYWFQQRGRIITNEYLAKWYLFWDSLTLNRTDGALIRLVTPIPESSMEQLAERELQTFLHEFNPLLSRFIPN